MNIDGFEQGISSSIGSRNIMTKISCGAPKASSGEVPFGIKVLAGRGDLSVDIATIETGFLT